WPHYGLDIAAVTGVDVIAPVSGIVTLAHLDMYYSGGTLILDHGQGLSSTFLHLSEILVKEGQYIEKGAVIAKVGATGRVTGAHLDWRINWFTIRLDPLLLVDGISQDAR
ncbi:MAG: murein DD-endopeptidase MepM/ murein hydrolase activator NlpD, partial [Enterobacterales bacterium]